MLRIDEKQLSRNVGTKNFPVTFLHEYGVAVIFDMLTLRRGENVQLPVLEGGISDNVLEGVVHHTIPAEGQGIAGNYPDIALLDAQHKAIRVIEVIVTSPVEGDKMARYRNLGIDVVQVPIRNAAELEALWPVRLFKQRLPRDPFSMRHDRDEPSEWAWERHTQARPNNTVDELIDALIMCSPSTRRRFAKALSELNSLDSLYPLQPDNPKGEILRPS